MNRPTESAAAIATPVVTVGIPAFNAEKYLEQTLSSILAQTFTNFELIVSDNASTDGTRAICEDLARREPRLRYVRQERNIGAPRNYNTLVRLARGRYLKWSSANDLIDPEFLSACVPILEARSDVVLVHTHTHYFNSGGDSARPQAPSLDLQEEDALERFKHCDQVLQNAANNVMNGVIRLAALRASTLHGDYPSSDIALMTELALYGKFVEVPQALFHRRDEQGAFFGKGTPGLHRSYYPDDRWGQSTRYWQRLRQMARGVRHSPLRLSQRLMLYAYLARRTWWHRRYLLLHGGSD